jgi:hypothetical protein
LDISVSVAIYKTSKQFNERMYNDIVNNNTLRGPSEFDAANEPASFAKINDVDSRPLIAQQRAQLDVNPKSQSNSNQSLDSQVKQEVERENISIEEFNGPEKDNLKYYNEPLTFVENLTTKSCMDNVSHVMDCESCRLLLKQKYPMAFGYNEFMEIGMYVLFGLFILALLDKLDSR